MLFLKKILKYIIALICHYTGLNNYLLNKSNQTYIFMFHKISQEPDFLHMSIHPEKLNAIISWCHSYGDIISLNDIKSTSWESTKFCITFDDGYKNNLDFVKSYPGVKAIIYLATSYIDTGKYFWADKMQSLILHSMKEQLDLSKYKLGSYRLTTIKSRKSAIVKLNILLKQLHPDKINEIIIDMNNKIGNDAETENVFLSWEDVIHLNEHKIDIGAHTHNHVITNKVSLQELEYELEKSNALITYYIHQPVIHFAYPNGTINDIFDDYEKTLQGFGYKTAVTTVEGPNDKSSDLFLLKRINITENRITNPLGFPSKAMFTTLLTNPFGIY